METVIKKWGINGEGIAYANKKAIFVENAIPGEKADIDIVRSEDSYDVAKAKNILEPSPRRRHPLCPKWESCGGCGLMHVDYKGQTQMKQQVLKEALKKYADYAGPIEPIIKNPSVLAYRNACKLPFGKKDGRVFTGMYARGTNELIEMDRCIIHSKKLEEARKKITEIADDFSVPVFSSDGQGLMTLVLKEFNDKVHVVFVTTDMELDNAMVNRILEEVPYTASVWQSVKAADAPAYELFGDKVLHLGGEMKMELSLGDLTLNMLPKSFFQLNTQQALNLYNLVASWAKGSKNMIEAYCGIGAISLFCADSVDKVSGIEIVEDAIVNAKENALLNGAENAHFACGDAAKLFEKMQAEDPADLLVVDPPRSGLDEPMKEAILSALPQRLIYVSCNPATLAKDLSRLQQEYAIQQVQPFDFFSQTPHIETAVLLEKMNDEQKAAAKEQKQAREKRRQQLKAQKASLPPARAKAQRAPARENEGKPRRASQSRTGRPSGFGRDKAKSGNRFEKSGSRKPGKAGYGSAQKGGRFSGFKQNGKADGRKGKSQ